MSGTQQHQDGASARWRTASRRSRSPAPPARVRHFGKLVRRRLAGRAAVLAGVPVLIVGLAAGIAVASGAGKVKIYASSRISAPSAITVGPDGALWFTNETGGPAGAGSIGRITTLGKVTSYTSASISAPSGIAAGPDGALWFTNPGFGGTAGSIGRITTAGKVTSYTSTSIDVPEGIAAGPDGALWFTNHMGGPGGAGSIGRITTAGTVTS
jgi:streptogramin lyase